MGAWWCGSRRRCAHCWGERRDLSTEQGGEKQQRCRIRDNPDKQDDAGRVDGLPQTLTGSAGKYERHASDPSDGNGVQGNLGGHCVPSYTRNLRRAVLDL